MQHILVVEDEEHLAIGIKYNLEAEGYLVTAIGDGPKALATVQESPQTIDLIILDLMLPGMSGYAVCEAIRAAGHNVPILMLSAGRWWKTASAASTRAPICICKNRSTWKS